MRTTYTKLGGVVGVAEGFHADVKLFVGAFAPHGQWVTLTAEEAEQYAHQILRAAARARRPS
jgi:hypothetical protein